MINPFTLHKRIKEMQIHVMHPLYAPGSHIHRCDHDILLYLTGEAIKDHIDYIKELCNSKLIAIAFEIVLRLGGASGLTREDFKRFTNYVNDGGLEAMCKMLRGPNKYKIFLKELSILPDRVKDNATEMLTKARDLHHDFVSEYFANEYKGKEIPSALLYNMEKTDAFISGLIHLAKHRDITNGG